jgi:hypothetical protein
VQLALTRILRIWLEISFTVLKMLFWLMTAAMLFLSLFVSAISQTGKSRR